MYELKTFRMNLKEMSEEGWPPTTQDDEMNDLKIKGIKKQFVAMCERVINYKNKNTVVIWKDDVSQFEKKYIVMNKDNIVLNYLEKHRTVDETLRNRPLEIFGNQIADAEMELENIIIDAYSAKPIKEFRESYTNMLLNLNLF